MGSNSICTTYRKDIFVFIKCFPKSQTSSDGGDKKLRRGCPLLVKGGGKTKTGDGPHNIPLVQTIKSYYYYFVFHKIKTF